jgi:MFS family permease
MSGLRWLPRPRPAWISKDREEHRRVVILIRALLLFEAAMYSAVTPVLPHYARALHAGKPAVGVLAAAYPAGMLPGSVVGAWIATRGGVRRTTLIGLLLFAVSIAGFGLVTHIVALDALRFLQGTACGCIWGGGLTWVIAVAPRERRGQILGSVIAAAIFGTLLGPVLGTLAVTIGTGPVFGVVGAVSVALAAWTLRHPEPPQPERDGSMFPRTLARDPRVLLGSWLILLEACTLGATGTLLPLRLSRFGASGAAIGLTFLLASLVSTFVAPLIGRRVDNRGALVPLVIGLSTTAVLIALMPLPHSALALAAISVIALGGPLTAYTIPSIAMITESAERAGVALAVATLLLNLAWATGETIGAPVAASVSQATSDTVPLLALAALMVLTLVPVLRTRLHGPAVHGGQAGAEPDPPAAPASRRERDDRVRIGTP